MTELIDTLERSQVRQVPDFRVGDRVRVHFQVVEGTRRRTQVFEGVVLKEKGGGPQRAFTVRKLSFGVGVERTFPVHSPKIERIEVVGRGEVRRAKLYYLRGRVGRRARLREMRDFRPEDVGMLGEATDGAAEETAAEAPPEPDAEPTASRRGAGAAADAPQPRSPQPRRPRARSRAEEDAAPPSRGRAEADERGRGCGGRRSRSKRPARATSRARPVERDSTEAARQRGHNSLLELVVIVAVAIGLALLIQAFLVKPYRIPSESMEPTLDVGQRVLVSRVNYKFSDPDRGDIVVFHPPKGAESNACGVEHAENELCPRPTAERDDVNFIKRIVAVPGDTLAVRDGHAIVNGKVQDGDDDVRPCAPGTCNFPQSDQDSAGSLFYDGRQSWGERRQPVLGSRPGGHGSSDRPSPPTGHPGESESSSAAERRQRPRSRGPAAGAARPAGCSGSTASSVRRFVAGADEAGRGSLAGPLVAAAVLLDYGRLTTREVRALTRLDDSKVHDAEQREALYPLVIRTAARVAVTSRCVRGIDERGLHVTNLAALRDMPQAGRRAGMPVPGRRLPRRRHGHAQQAVDRRRRAQRGDRGRVRGREGDPRPLHAPGRRSCPGGSSTSNVGYSTPEHRAAIASSASATCTGARSSRSPISSSAIDA